MVPCYKEGLEVISATVAAAMEADLPPGVTRTLYLCDDGKVGATTLSEGQQVKARGEGEQRN
jgi:hypothetical protein